MAVDYLMSTIATVSGCLAFTADRMDALWCIREKCHGRLLVVVDPASGA